MIEMSPYLIRISLGKRVPNGKGLKKSVDEPTPIPRLEFWKIEFWARS